MDNRFLQQLPHLKKEITEKMHEYICKKKKEYSYSGKTQKTTLLCLDEFVTRGKCIRGSLAYYVASQLGYPNTLQLLSFAAGLEFVHSALLIHDDIIDNDLLRRGKPSVYAQYISEKKNPSLSAIDSAKAVALCVGDIALFMAFELFDEALSDHKQRSAIMYKLMRDYVHTGFGQIDDILLSNTNAEVSLQQILQVYLYKTAKYTFSLPLTAGALLTGTSKEIVRSLEEIGNDMGIVFQMRDDEIALFQNSGEVGKPIDSDIRKNTKTFIRYYLYSESTPKEKKMLTSIFNKKQLTSVEIELVRALAVSTGALKKITTHQRMYMERAKQNIQKLSVHLSIKSSLDELLTYCVNRTS